MIIRGLSRTGELPALDAGLLAAINAELLSPAVQQQREAAAQADLEGEIAREEYRGETLRLMGLENAPLGVLMIGGGALLALGASGDGGWNTLLRWVGGGTLAASLAIAVRRALAGM